MKLKNKVCTLEQSKKLKYLGFKIDTVNFWVIDDSNNSSLKTLKEIKKQDSAIPAPCGLELGEVLIEKFQELPVYIYEYEFNNPEDTKDWCLSDTFYKRFGDFKDWPFLIDDCPETHARAELVIWLIENKYM